MLQMMIPSAVAANAATPAFKLAFGSKSLTLADSGLCFTPFAFAKDDVVALVLNETCRTNFG
jgi:hypothetical protein